MRRADDTGKDGDQENSNDNKIIRMATNRICG